MEGMNFRTTGFHKIRDPLTGHVTTSMMHVPFSSNSNYLWDPEKHT